MPTVVLKGDIPYKVIHPQKSLFPIEPRIFGCTCYVRDTRPFVTKLDPKALKFSWGTQDYKRAIDVSRLISISI